jgi:hypothetical protein
VLEKATQLSPNPKYPEIDADDDFYRKGVTLMAASVRVIERSYKFAQRPFNYLLELCTRSNAIASNCKLSRNQQIALILSFIPQTSSVYKDLLLAKGLDEIFHYANLCADSTYTRTELLNKIDAWRLEYSSYSALNESLAQLRTFYADLSGQGYENVDKSSLYLKVIRRVKKEKSIPNFIHRMLDESALKVERESDAGVMLELLLAPLKYMLNQKPKSVPLTHAVSAGG